MTVFRKNLMGVLHTGLGRTNHNFYIWVILKNCSLFSRKILWKATSRTPFCFILRLKVHKHEIILNFFLPKFNPYTLLVNFREKKIASLPLARISNFERFRGDWPYAEPNFLESYPKIFFFQIVPLGPIRWVRKWFFKIWIFYSRNLHFNLGFWVIFKNYSMRMLSIRGNDFIAHWAYKEMFTSRISRPNRIRLSKISCYRPLGPSGFCFCK